MQPSVPPTTLLRHAVRWGGDLPSLVRYRFSFTGRP